MPVDALLLFSADADADRLMCERRREARGQRSEVLIGRKMMSFLVDSGREGITTYYKAHRPLKSSRRHCTKTFCS